MNASPPQLPPGASERVEEPRRGGTIFPGSGIALVRYEDDHYFIQLSAYSYKEVVHKLTPGELARIHMHNLHLMPGFQLSIEEIGDPPFTEFLEILKYEHGIEACFRDMDTLLDPYEQTDVKFRYGAVQRLEEFLREVPRAREAILERLGSFIPPEDYKIDTDAF